ncbi:MAG TPA: acyl-CoA dehydrogenase [Deltaproteobacteria bacterium]|nr:acyl-CoA dehydrogenase [Deltaproteobacteria bacterium]
MAEKFVSETNLKFLIHDVFDVGSLTRYPYYGDHNDEVFDMVIDTALKVGEDLLHPYFEEMDRRQPELLDGRVKVHPHVKTIMREFGAGGWIGADFPYEAGGQQLPLTIMLLSEFIFDAANYSAAVYASLTSGAAGLIESFGTEEMKETYLPLMMSGEWQGTMALTEPQAGSSLADTVTSAEPTDEGYYKLRGQKIFISAADHDGVENIIHLLLAKIKGAPAGVRGISLFVVPRERITGDGSLEFNDVHSAGIYHKMGYRGSPIVQLSLGEENDCRGWLVGEPNRGLAYMFQMMNGARIGVGLGATGIASAAYYASLQYSKERQQGRRLSNKDPESPQVRLIEHSDIRRMLLFQRAVVEGSLSLLVQCAYYHDMERLTEGEEKEKYALLLDLLTPVAKSYPAEMGILSVSAGLQCLGGYGYCEEFPLEQNYRDMRIHPIHEGTTGIQGMDLLGRKMVMKDGKAGELYLREVTALIDEALTVDSLAKYARSLEDALELLQTVTAKLMDVAANKGRDYFLADATVYLEFFGIIAIAWQWLKQALVAQKALDEGSAPEKSDFYLGKLAVCAYFFGYELPKISGLATVLTEAEGLTVEMTETLFDD